MSLFILVKYYIYNITIYFKGLNLGRKKIKDIDNFDKTNIKYYYGISNYDTIYSTGKASPIEAYEYAYKIGLNFMFTTDYNYYLSNEVYLKESKYSKFQGSKIYAARIN